MPASKTECRKWLLDLSVRVVAELSLPSNIIKPSPLKAGEVDETDTNGWAVAVGSIRGESNSSLEVWLDDYANAGDRRVWFTLRAFGSRRNQYLKEVLEEVTVGIETAFGKFEAMDNSHWKTSPDRLNRLSPPLPAKLFGRPLKELYTGAESDSFLSLCHSLAPVIPGTPAATIVTDGARFFREITLAIINLRLNDEREVDETENRAKFRTHKQWERNAKASRAAKVRDSFICKVCGFAFAAMYGEYGIGYAETHHVVPLSKLKEGDRILPEDLVTVCANCHRMLHRMKGIPQDVEELRRIVTKTAAAKILKRN
jgi:5-methylcytosine-specific restriction endonuclease McrA